MRTIYEAQILEVALDFVYFVLGIRGRGAARFPASPLSEYTFNGAHIPAASDCYKSGAILF